MTRRPFFVSWLMPNKSATAVMRRPRWLNNVTLRCYSEVLQKQLFSGVLVVSPLMDNNFLNEVDGP